MPTNPYARRDPAGYGGQWGGYTDPETGLVLMTHHYYDGAAGRFVTRDPIGYGGGINLYGYAGNNPVNMADPDGLRPLTATDRGRLHRLGGFAGREGVSSSEVNRSVSAIKAAIAAVPTGSADPVSLRASFRAIDRLGDTRYGWESRIDDAGMSTILWTKPKCNIFVGNAYAYGGGLGFGGEGVPTTDTAKFFGLVHRIFPPSASDYANSSKTIGRFSFISQVSSPGALSGQQVGDIVAFSHGGNHVTLSLGGSLLIYAGQYNVKVQTDSYVWDNEGRGFITTRRFAP